MSTTSSTSDRLKLESKAELLRFNPTSPVVYERWLRAQYAEAGKLYGIYATIFLTGLRHVPMMPIAPEGYDDMEPHNPNAVLFLKRINTYAQAVELSNTTDQKLFGQMWANMSEDSINRVSRVHPVEHHQLILGAMDAQALLQRIRASHQGAGATIPALNWDAASTTFYTLQQEAGEELSDFKQRFDAAIRAMEVVAHPNIPIQAMMAVRLLNSLDKRKYRNFIAHVENEAISGAAVYPATLDNAYGRAVNYRLPPGDPPRASRSDPTTPSSTAMVADVSKPRSPRQKKTPGGKVVRFPSPPVPPDKQRIKPPPTGAGGKPK